MIPHKLPIKTYAKPCSQYGTQATSAEKTSAQSIPLKELEIKLKVFYEVLRKKTIREANNDPSLLSAIYL